MHSSSIDWDQLKIVLTVARAGNLTKAAQILGINQSTVGRRLSALEQQLGTELFFRSNNTMTVTESGKVLVAQAEVIESATQNALEQIGRMNAQPEGLIRFVTMGWICNHLILPKLSHFYASYPNIEVQAIADTRERFFDQGEVEIALRFEMRSQKDVLNIPVVEIPYAIYGPADSELESLPWLGFRVDQIHTEPERWLQNRADDNHVRFWANDAGIIYQGIRGGIGKALLPEILGESDPKLVRISGAEPEIVRTLHIQVLPAIQRLKRVEIFFEWLTEMLKTTVP